MVRILHISDLHFGPKYLPEVGNALLRTIGGLGAEIIVVSGDFTQRAKPAQYREAQVFLDQLPELPLIVVPGNHDVPLYRFVERLTAPYAHYRRFISDELDSVFRQSGIVIVSLNTTSPLLRITRGRVTRAQLNFCAESFAGAPEETARIVVAHHHFAPAPDYENEDDTIPNARTVLDRFGQLGVELILGGHLHRAYIGNSLDIYPGKDRAHGIIIVQAGTATSRRGRGREREKNSFNVVDVLAREIHVTHYMYFTDTGGFQPVGRHVFPRRTHPYLTADGERP